MFNIGDVVLYGTTGVCKVEGVSEVALGRDKKQYYVLHPVAQGSSTVYVPTDNERLLSKVRKTLTKSEIDHMLTSLPADSEVWSDDTIRRAQLFSDTLKSGDREAVVLMIRTLCRRKNDLAKNGKKLHIADEKALRDAQRLLFDEFSYVLGIQADKVEGYILAAVCDEKTS